MVVVTSSSELLLSINTLRSNRRQFTFAHEITNIVKMLRLITRIVYIIIIIIVVVMTTLMLLVLRWNKAFRTLKQVPCGSGVR